MSDDEDEEQVAETGEDGKELIENEIFGGDDDDEGSVIQQPTTGAAEQTEFDLEQSDEESGLMIRGNTPVYTPCGLWGCKNSGHSIS